MSYCADTTKPMITNFVVSGTVQQGTIQKEMVPTTNEFCKKKTKKTEAQEIT